MFVHKISNVQHSNMDLVSTIFESSTNLDDLTFVIYVLIEYVNESLISNFKMSIMK
jgi:hypothetical protein